MKLYTGKLLLTGLMAAALAVQSPVSALAFGPGDAISSTVTTGTTTDTGITGDLTSDWWHGYVYQDGSGYTYLEKGISVSKFQNLKGNINWTKVKADGVDFAMIRIAYGTTLDPYFAENVAGAQAAGIKVGAYLCSTAQNLDQAVYEAAVALTALQGITLQYPVAYDVEVSSMLSGGATSDGITEMINTFCNYMRTAGYTPMVYANTNWINNHMNKSQIPYAFWFAQYPNDKVYKPVSGINITIWQSSDKGTVSGITGNVTTEMSNQYYGGMTGTSHGVSAAEAYTATGSGSSVVGHGVDITKNGPIASGTTSSGSTSGPSASGNTSAATGSSTMSSSLVTTSGTWVKNASGQYNYLVNGQMTTGWQKDGALWYYMDENGVMKTGWVQVNGTWYWLGYHGDMKTGWQSINDKWYYFTESGAMLENTTVTLGGVPCTFDASGAWVTG